MGVEFRFRFGFGVSVMGYETVWEGEDGNLQGKI